MSGTYSELRNESIVLPPRSLNEIGMSLFGENWVSPLAKRLTTQRRTVQRWKGGSAKCSGPNAVAILLMLEHFEKLGQFPKLKRILSEIMDES
jgi:hypothetical protein